MSGGTSDSHGTESSTTDAADGPAAILFFNCFPFCFLSLLCSAQLISCNLDALQAKLSAPQVSVLMISGSFLLLGLRISMEMCESKLLGEVYILKRFWGRVV